MAKASIEETPERILDNLRKIVKEAEGMLEKAEKEVSPSEWQKVKDSAIDAYHKLCDQVPPVKQYVEEGVKTTQETVKNHPGTTMAVCLGIGVALGALLTRK